MNVKFPNTSYLSPSLIFWSNFLTVTARLKGVTFTIRMIQWASHRMPLQTGSLSEYSEQIDGLVKTLPFLFINRKQKCLIRGLVLYFMGKRLKLNVILHFGSKIENQRFNTHCWISQDGQIRFEVDEVIQQYTSLVRYA